MYATRWTIVLVAAATFADFSVEVAEGHRVVSSQQRTFMQRDASINLDVRTGLAAREFGIARGCSSSSCAACRVLDVDKSTAVNASDQAPHAALAQRLLRKPGQAVSGLGQVFAHEGLPLDGRVGSYQNRARIYEPDVRRFMQRDPLAEAYARSSPTDATLAVRIYEPSLYLAVRVNPTGANDPLGLHSPYIDQIFVATWSPSPPPPLSPYWSCVGYSLRVTVPFGVIGGGLSGAIFGGVAGTGTGSGAPIFTPGGAVIGGLIGGGVGLGLGIGIPMIMCLLID